MEIPLASYLTVKSKLLIWWIDDETDRLTPAAQRGIAKPTHPSLNRRAAQLELKHVASETDTRAVVSGLVEAAASRRLPDLVVIDQILNVQSSDGVVERGSSLAVRLRVQVPSVPLVGVTGVPFGDITALQKDQFIELFSRDAIHKGDGVPDLFAIADGFATLIEGSSRVSGTAGYGKALLSFLDAPRVDMELLLSCIPGEFKCPWDKETPHSFARWVRHTLMGYPGFLYDDLEIATIMGLKETGLRRLAEQFEDCRYDGVFASASRRRWWVSSMRMKLRKLTRSVAAKTLAALGRRLVGDTHKAEFSKCYGEKAPQDCVPNVTAYKDERCDLRNRVQARIEDTVPVEIDTPPIGFEQRRRLS